MKIPYFSCGISKAVEIFKVKEIFNLFDLDPQLHKVQVNVVGGDEIEAMDIN